jgi:hypothetical protein
VPAGVLVVHRPVADKDDEEDTGGSETKAAAVKSGGFEDTARCDARYSATGSPGASEIASAKSSGYVSGTAVVSRNCEI